MSSHGPCPPIAHELGARTRCHRNMEKVLDLQKQGEAALLLRRYLSLVLKDEYKFSTQVPSREDTSGKGKSVFTWVHHKQLKSREE